MRTLFVDFFGTLCSDQFWRTLPVAQFERVQRAIFVSDPVTVNEWMRGNFTSEDINRLAASRTGIAYADLWAAFERDCRTMRVSKGALDAVASLRSRFRVVLITDNMDCFDRFTVPALGLNDFFDDIANSSREGCLKLDRHGEMFYNYLVGDLEDSVLMDDSEEICDFFSGLGGTAYLVTNAEPARIHLEAVTAV